MDLRWNRKSFATVLAGLLLCAVSFADRASASLASFSLGTKGVQPETLVSTHGTSAEQQLERCIEIAKQGDVKQAFELAKQTKQMFGSQRMFDVSYINTLMTIVDETESTCDVKIINEVIVVVNQAKQTRIYDGTGDPEIAFHFMKALERLATLTTVFSDSVTSKIRIFEGQIAVNLKTNPNYPKNALEALAAPMVDMAKGYAFRKESDQAFAALNSAVSVGFGEFAALKDEDWLKAIADDATMKKLQAQLTQSYAIAVDNWSRTVVSQFRPMSFQFNLESLAGGRVTNQSFAGKVVVLDLWATWCPPCRKGIPHYMELHKQYEDKGLTVLGVSMDQPTDLAAARQAVAAFAEKQPFNYPIAIGEPAIESQLTEKMVLPTTIFFDRNGQVRYIARGYHDYAKVEAISKVLLNENQNVGASTAGAFNSVPMQNF